MQQNSLVPSLMPRKLLNPLDTLTETVASNVAACVRVLSALEKKRHNLDNSFYDVQIEFNTWMNGQYFKNS